MSVFRVALASTVTAVTLANFAAPPPAAAQDVQYESVVRIDMPGAVGRAMRIAARLGGASTETVEKTSIRGKRMRTDVDRTSTIMDLEGRRVISLDHRARTYTVMTFDQMAAQVREAGAAMRDERREARRTESNVEANFRFRFAVEPGNQRQRVAGYDAERFFLTMEAEGEARAEGAAEMEKAGTLVVLTDMWTSKDTPILRARGTFDDAAARQYAEAGASITEALAMAFADEPGYQVAWEQSVSEARKMEGMPVRTVTTFVAVAPGKAFDRALVTDPQPQGGPNVARAAGRAALGRLAGGRLGGAQAEPAAQAEPTQATMVTVTSEVRNVSTAALDPSLFEIPAGYREVKPGS
jgi:hypothetical protein